MPSQDFGLIGLAVMGQNLALNVESKGFSVAVYNRTTARTQEFMAGPAKGKSFVGAESLEDFVAALSRPRKIMLMVKAGQPVDDFIEQLLPHLDKGDLIIDGGNSHFPDTVRRNKALAEKGFLYIGTGVSGGEEGALLGPSIMPGGQREAYDLVEPILTKIAAQVDGESCCTHIGPDGAGHYVKMVHNGIEYGDMQLIVEAYFIMQNSLNLTASTRPARRARASGPPRAPSISASPRPPSPRPSSPGASPPSRTSASPPPRSSPAPAPPMAATPRTSSSPSARPSTPRRSAPTPRASLS